MNFKKSVVISLIILFILSGCTNVTKLNSKINHNYLICIDPGHQRYGNLEVEPNGPGSDVMKAKVAPGTKGIKTNKPEYELNLEISEKINKVLSSKGYEVIMTRISNDVNISNIERTAIANNNNANILIRIHANGSDNSKKKGASLFITGQNNPYVPKNLYAQNQILAKCILEKLSKAQFTIEKGIIERDDLTGNNWAKVPTVLIEIGFMTNKEEDVMLSTDKYQQKLADSISEGVEAYLESTK